MNENNEKQAEREAFEAWYNAHWPNHEYLSDEDTAWEAWQARANQSGAAAEMVARQSAEPVALPDAKTLALGAMVDAMRWWGTQEDGIPGECKKAFDSAMLALGWSYSHPQDLKVLATPSAATGAQGLTDERALNALRHFVELDGVPEIHGAMPVALRAFSDEARAILAHSAPRADHSEDARQMVVTGRMVQSALEAGWNEFVSDTGCYPACFEVQRGKRIEADFRRAEGAFLEYIAASLNASLAAAPSASAQQADQAIGWTDDADANAALLMLDRLDVSGEDDARVDAIAATIRRLAAPPPSASPAALTDAARRLMLAADDVDLGRSIHNERKPDDKIEGALWDELRRASAAVRALLAASPAAPTDETIKQLRDTWIASLGYAPTDPELNVIRIVLAAQQPAAAAPQSAAQDARDDEPDMFWNHDDPERCQDSIHNVVIEAYENGSNVGDIVEVQQAIRLHNIKVRIIADPEDSEEISYEPIEDAAMSASKEGNCNG